MVKVMLYIEGGGESKFTQRHCSRGFGKLLEKAGLKRMPGTSAWGSRNEAFKRFKTAIKTREPDEYPILLVDSEDIIDENTASWNHLKNRDGWICPPNVSEDQAQLMVTCMETWVMADRAALSDFYGLKLQESALLSDYNLEQYDRHLVQQRLEHATRDCDKQHKPYKKGKRSFQVLETLNPNTLKQRLPYFKRFLETLEAHLQ